jgi:DNA-binding transcriptional ArsR family regulator
MITLKRSESIELVCAVFRFSMRDVQESKKKELGISGITEIETWIGELEEKLDPFLKADIDLIVRQIPITSWIMIRFCRESDKGGGIEDFFSRLDEISVSEFEGFITASLGCGSDTELTEEVILNGLTETSSNALIEPEKEAAMIFNMLKNSAAFLSRTKKLYHDFYLAAIEDSVSRFSGISEEKYRWHKAQLEKDPTTYLDGVTRQLYSSMFEGEPVRDIYYSFYFDYDVFLSTDREPIMVIGAGADEILISRSDRVKTDILFNTLGDGKRLEIIRLISERPWYSGELAAHFGITPATMSYHLNKLVSAGFLTIKPGEQKRYYYNINRENIRSFFRAAERDTIGSGEEL